MGHGPRKLAIFFLGLTAAAPSRAFAMNQVEALSSAAAVAKSGSDQSLQSSTTSAMQAMMDLAAANTPGAVNHGYEAFGKYKTSQNLDADRIRNRIRQIDLFTSNLSVNSPPPPPELVHPREVFFTTFARLDPKFLHQGEAGKVADQFEKQSGMSREAFLKRMAEASESTISADDPNLTAKVMQKFSRFLDGIPNDEFRQKVQEQIDKTSAKSRSQLIVDGARHVFEVLAAKGIQLGQKVAALDLPSAEVADRAPSSIAQGASPDGPASARPENPYRKQDFQNQYMAAHDADFRGLDHEKFGGDTLGRIMQTAMDEQSETIFKQVSKRYRAVAPSMK